MALGDLSDWLDEHTKPGIVWYAKRLSANDTLANNAHQAGPYIPKEFLFRVFPALDQPDAENPRVEFDLYVDSHVDHRKVRAIWYNNRLRGGTRNEARLTNFGGQQSALLNPDSTGALTLFAFTEPGPGPGPSAPGPCHVWLCDHATQEDLIEERIGPVEPGRWRIWPPPHGALPLTDKPVRVGCRLSAEEIPPAWLTTFPSPIEIIAKTIELRPDHNARPDVRLMRRRDCEYEIFQSVEEAVELPVIQHGFTTIEDFLGRAQSMLQRRKARAGRSLELHTRMILTEEGLREDEHFSYQPESDPGKSPDFLFPSEAAYKDSAFPAGRLRMLAVKTTCKDRWRQILNEADRVPTKHLLTLQEGVSANQFKEMSAAGVKLIVPEGLRASYPESIRIHLQSLESFIGDIRLLRP